MVGYLKTFIVQLWFFLTATAESDSSRKAYSRSPDAQWRRCKEKRVGGRERRGRNPPLSLSQFLSFAFSLSALFIATLHCLNMHLKQASTRSKAAIHKEIQFLFRYTTNTKSCRTVEIPEAVQNLQGVRGNHKEQRPKIPKKLRLPFISFEYRIQIKMLIFRRFSFSQSAFFAKRRIAGTDH